MEAAFPEKPARKPRIFGGIVKERYYPPDLDPSKLIVDDGSIIETSANALDGDETPVMDYDH